MHDMVDIVRLTISGKASSSASARYLKLILSDVITARAKASGARFTWNLSAHFVMVASIYSRLPIEIDPLRKFIEFCWVYPKQPDY